MSRNKVLPAGDEVKQTNKIGISMLEEADLSGKTFTADALLTQRKLGRYFGGRGAFHAEMGSGFQQWRQRHAYERRHRMGSSCWLARSQEGYRTTPQGGLVEVRGIRGEGRRNIEIVPALPDLLRTCIRHESERPLKGDRNVRAFHHFAGVVDLDGELRRVRLTVREMPDGQRFYDHISERTENLAVMANAGSAEEATLDRTRFSAIEHLIGGFHYRDQRS